ncbi:MAG: hypothetical protein LBS79_10380 [Tannerella sp.]|nr:hypothetical protein [Tannerella sp.]
MKTYRMKMKQRIASLFLFGMALLLCTCTNERIDPNPGTEPGGPVLKGVGNISLKILVPTGSISTYADTDASINENFLDTLYVDLYQGGSTPIKESKFSGDDLKKTGPNDPNDSILTVGYEVDNIAATGALTAKVYANRKTVKIIGEGEEIPLPLGTAATSFFMSGETKTPLSYNSAGAAYEGTVQLERDVAKVRVNISKNTVFLPSDLVIDYDNVKIQVLKVANQTSLFPGTDVASGQAGFAYINYPERGSTALRRSPSFNIPAGSGGQIDSFYVYENDRSLANYNDDTKTKVKVRIPTSSLTEGAKTIERTYDLYTNSSYTLKRNYIYTLDIKVRGQSLDPVITVSVLPWDDVNVDGNIYGTYLTVDKSEIVFEPNGEAIINFCTDAQAVYFDFDEFNNSNPKVIGFDILPVGIDINNGLAPEGFKSGQILLDQQHCGSFGFKVDPEDFPGFPTVNFSGKIRMKAGNIVKYLTFPAVKILDAHFIVGDNLLGIDTTYTSANVYRDPGDNTEWLKISQSRTYSGMLESYNGAATKLYLHLDENLTGSIRTGSVTVTTGSGSEKKIRISQLPAIPVGRFGYVNSVTDDSIYSAMLYTEQLYEFNTMPQYIKTENDSYITNNAIYNGRMTAISSYDGTNYNANFNYQEAIYQAINYCAYKNRITTPSSSDLKWYLPSQAQLMGMWLSYTSYKDKATSNFKRKDNSSILTPADVFWSSTDNIDYAKEAQYMNFQFGNVGHYKRVTKSWVRCVRDGASANSMISASSFPVVNFGNGGMPEDSYTTTSKTSGGKGGGDELSDNNKTLYKTLRIAVNDHESGVEWNINACDDYSEGGVGSYWRLPTQRELQAIWILQNEIKKEFLAFTLLANDYYWSATSAKETETATGTNIWTNAWTIFGSGSRTTPGASGNTPHQHKSRLLRVRCVREVTL